MLVGFGSIAESTHLAALASCQIEVGVVVEPNLLRQAAAQACLPHARIVSRLEEALEDTTLDVADICTPPDLHYEAARTCLQGGLHVLCEKPLATGLAHSQKLHAISEARGLVLACVHNWTQAPICQRALSHIVDRKLGALLTLHLKTMRTAPAGVAAGKSNWRTDPARAGGGILYDHGWHGLSLMFRAFGETPLWVRGRTTSERYLDLGVEDTVSARLGFSGEREGLYEASWAADVRRNEATYLFERGRIEIVDDTLQIFRKNAEPTSERFDESLAGGGYRPAWTAALIREFLAEIAQPHLRGTLAREALAIQSSLADIYRSGSQSGERVERSVEHEAVSKLYAPSNTSGAPV